MVNNIAIFTAAFLLTEISILYTKIFGSRIIQSSFLKAVICLYTTHQVFFQWHGW